MARFLVQTIPNKLPELLINLSSKGPHLMGATLSTLLRAFQQHFGTRSIFIAPQPPPETSVTTVAGGAIAPRAQRPHGDMWMPLWICSQEKAHVPGEIYQRRELSARAALFCGWWEWEYKLD